MWEAIKRAAYNNRWSIYRDVFTILVGGFGLGVFAVMIGLNLHFPSVIVGVLIPMISNRLDSLFDRKIRPDGH